MFNKLFTSKDDYNILVSKAKCYDRIIKCIDYAEEIKYDDIKAGNNDSLVYTFPTKVDKYLNVRVLDLLKEAGIDIKEVPNIRVSWIKSKFYSKLGVNYEPEN
jgi:hypothetical protein